jgi:hypothetical protein
MILKNLAIADLLLSNTLIQVKKIKESELDFP